MKKFLKKPIAFFCIILMLVSLAPTGVMAANENENGDYKLIALTFDDGPGPYTAKLLDALKEKNVPATFFVVGTGAKAHPDLLKRMINEGHQLANHTYDHAKLSSVSASKILSEISTTRNLLVEAGGEQTYYIRPPYGAYNETVKANAGAPLIMWSVDPLDWKYRNTNTVINNVMKDTKDGDIILLHDIHSTSVDAAIILIDKLRDKGYEFVTVSELLRRRGVTPQNGGVYNSAKNKGINLGPKAEVDETYYDETKLEEHWAYDSIRYAIDNGIISENEKGEFLPDWYITRGDFVKALAMMHIKSGGTLSGSETDTDGLNVDTPDEQQPDKGIINPEKPEAGNSEAENSPVEKIEDSGSDNETKEPDTEINDQIDSADEQEGTEPKSAEISFSDVPQDSPYYDYVKWAAEAGIMQGYGDGVFGIKDFLTREQMAVCLYRYMDYLDAVEWNDEGYRFSYKDLESISDWALSGVGYCSYIKLLQGDTDGNFKPQKNTTRAQVASLIHRQLT